MKIPSLGSVSSGTMRNEDLIPTFAALLLELDDEKTFAHLCDEAAGLDFEAEGNTDNADVILVELFSALGEFAPKYCYFGAHPGDGANYGFWVYEEFDDMFGQDNDDEIRVSDTGEIPADFTGLAAVVSDHGNTTLYSVDNGVPAEIWSQV